MLNDCDRDAAFFETLFFLGSAVELVCSRISRGESTGMILVLSIVSGDDLRDDDDNDDDENNQTSTQRVVWTWCFAAKNSIKEDLASSKTFVQVTFTKFARANDATIRTKHKIKESPAIFQLQKGVLVWYHCGNAKFQSTTISIQSTTDCSLAAARMGREIRVSVTLRRCISFKE